MSSIKYSFVIPVYQTKKYLSMCVDSLLNQSYKNFEIILVDDGSDDGSSDLCDKYLKIDNRIKTIHKSNNGQGAARNDGVSLSQGEYIIFIDSDDWWDDNTALEKIDKLTNETDVVVFDIKEIYKDKIKEMKFTNKFKTEYNNGIEFINDALSKIHSYPWYPVVYAFKKEIWQQNKITFPSNTFFEDTATIYKIPLFAGKVKVLKESFYCYRKNVSSSTTKNVNTKLLTDHINVCKNAISYITDLKLNKKTTKLLCNNMACGYIDVVNHLVYLQDIDKLKIIEELNKNINVFNYVDYGKQKIMKNIIRIIGFDKSSKFFTRIKKLINTNV